MSKDREIEIAIQADDLLNNKAFLEAMARIKGDIFDQIADSKWFQRKKREHMYLKLKSVLSLERELIFMVNDKPTEPKK